ncbi:MAG: TetR/AcrR family transcriptional regulator [Deltaproteobacteria bacterium]|nr:TetR/AcrR family transcriptional regulator [Deltaproteobacteria bacterium]
MASRDKQNGKYERILDAAVRVFSRKGYFGSTVSQIAGEAGVADGTIYLYFKNKEDILASFVRRHSQEFFDRVKDEIGGQPTAVDKLRTLVRLHFEASSRDRHRALVYQVEMRRSSRLMKAEIREALKMYLDLVGSILEEGQQEGTIRLDLYVGLAKRMIFASVDEVITSWVISGGKYDLPALADPLVDLFLNGIATRPTA